jgi:hypothetical protein
MNVRDLLYDFLDKAISDSKICARHVSLYANLLRLLNVGETSFARISRRDLMLRSKIRSKSVYYKSIKELADWGYITYAPSYDPSKKSIAILSNSDQN